MGSRFLAIALVLFFGGEASASPDLRTRIDTIFAGPEARLRSLLLQEDHAVIGLDIPSLTDRSEIPTNVENQFEVAVGALAASRPEIETIHLLVARPREPLRPPFRLRGPRRKNVLPYIRSNPDRFPFGQALSGKTVAISAGHGYIYYDSLGGYSTQRGRIKWNGCGSCRGILEDFETHEIVVRFLVPLLEGAGARVVLVRERDYNSEGTIVDDGDATYREVLGTFQDGTSAGGNDGDYRTSDSSDAAAAWTLSAPMDGEQLLSFWFVDGANRYADALLEVTDPSGTHRFLFDGQSHGRRWTPIRRLDLNRGDTVTVRVEAPANGSGYLIADAARLGAGKHTTNHPWWKMGAKPFATYQDAPSSVTSRGDVTIRPVYAEFYGADVYLSLHSNASGQPDSTAAGTSSYRYSCRAFPDHSNDPDASQCDDPSGSDRLQELVHNALVDQIKTDWDPNWRDRGTKVANFGEVRELDGIPGTLVESAFHDNVRLPSGSNLRMTDNQALHDPRWRRAAAYGMYKGLSAFLVGNGPLLLPPPTELVLKRVDGTSLELLFNEVNDADGYRLYVARGNRTFDQGQVISGSPFILSNLTPELPVAVRVASLNAAGEGLSSSIVAARPSVRRAQVLIVDAFQREDAWVQEIDNRHDTLLTHALALADVAVAFDGANEAALTAGRIAFADYDGVVLALGRESTEHHILTADLRTQIGDLVHAGGAVFASGSEIAWALDAQGDEDTRAFLESVFGAAYASDDAAATRIRGIPGGWFATLSGLTLADDENGLLETRSSDVLSAASGAAVIHYDNGSDIAAVQKDRNLVLGVALDSVVDADARASLLGTWATEAIDLDPIIPTDAGVTPPPDAGVTLPDAGSLLDAGVEPDATTTVNRDASEPDIRFRFQPGPSLEPVSGGCDCNQMGRPTETLGWAFLIALFFLSRSRRED